MSALLLALRNLCLLRIGPQDLPYSPSLLGTVLGLNLLIDTMTGWLLGRPGSALAASLLSLIVIMVGLYLLLKMRNFQVRFVQAALAVAATALLFSVLAVPVQLMLHPMPADPTELSDPQRWAMLVLAGLGGWSLAVTGHILRHALERSFFAGILLALMLNLATLAFLGLLLPETV